MIAAAGRGERLGRPEPKAFVELRGRPLVAYTLEALRRCPQLDEIILIVAPSDVERARRTLLQPGRDRTEKVVAGGTERRESVRNGLAEANASASLLLVHDGARPFVSEATVARCLAAAAEFGAAIAALPSTDTVKEAGPEDFVATTLDRSRIWLVQTPQVFRRELLVRAHEAAAEAGVTGTDDAALVERLGHRVKLVLGDADNIKITSPEDLLWAERFLAQGERRVNREARTGIGFDAHRFAGGRPLVLAGVHFPGEQGLLGYSDADVVCHAICDAVLGAIAAGDIGQHFPDSDPRFAGISSLALLARVAQLAKAAGWEVENIDVVVIAEAPRVAPKLPEMRRAVAEATGTGVERVSIKGKTTEGMGFTGRREGIASHAVCTLRRAAAG